MDVLKGWSIRSEGNASTTLSSSCAAGHTCNWLKDGQSQSLLQVKREREAPQSGCNIEALQNNGPSLKSVREMLNGFAAIDTRSEAVLNRVQISNAEIVCKFQMRRGSVPAKEGQRVGRS
jgi:hypothetical protein